MANIKKPPAKINIKDCILISLFSALIAVFSFISIPSPVPFTLQTAAIFICLTVLGGKKGTISIILYIFLGIIGLPVFNGFSGGVGHLFGATGGYILGFVPLALVYTLITKVFGNSFKSRIIGLSAGLTVCYAAGTLWFCCVYLRRLDLSTFATALVTCVLPFIIPDIIKIGFSALIGKRITDTVKE